MLSRPMPFRAVPCMVWLPTYAEDAYGNRRATYAEEPSITTTCCYAPGRSEPDTSDDIEEDRPHGATVTVTFFLPKSLQADLRGARIACAPPDDPAMAAQTFDVVGTPYSYPRASTPGDYSWCVEGVANLG